uniref:Uncharacterized protein n=1 Tax=viral metagenome TaxID=1070528 RepID=A0A6C0AEL7_9ZZZZ
MFFFDPTFGTEKYEFLCDFKKSWIDFFDRLDKLIELYTFVFKFFLFDYYK